MKQVVGKVDLIHSVDSERLLRAIDAQAAKQDLVQDILLEVNIAGEESKGGCTPEEARQLTQLTRELEHVRLRGPDGNSTHLPGTWGQPPVFCRYATAFC